MSQSRPRGDSLWATVDARREPAAPAPAVAPARRLRWVVDAALPLVLTVVVAILVLLPPDLSAAARLSLFAFALAVILWSTTVLNAAFVALAAVMVLILSGGGPQEYLFDALASDVIWLMIGAFILGGALQQTGLAGRLTRVVVARAGTVRGVFWLLTTVLLPLSLFIPSTSGRAAVAIPVFRSLSNNVKDERVTRALALLIPTVILVATVSTLIGAGSHLIANDLLGEITGTRISFARWALWGVPFGAAASYLSCWVVTRFFLDRERLDRKLSAPPQERRPFSRDERYTLGVLALMVSFWLTESMHGLEIATVTTAGALLLTLPGFGVLSWKDGLKTVSWNLIVFVGAALVLGYALIDSGAAPWIIEGLFAASGLADTESHLLIVLILGLLSLTSHLYMTSHTARAAALVPPLLYVAASLEVSPVAVLFLSTVGMDYCLTFPVSSKALLMYQELGGATFQPADLLRLSAILLPLHVVLMLLFYYGYWQFVGLAL